MNYSIMGMCKNTNTNLETTGKRKYVQYIAIS